MSSIILLNKPFNVLSQFTGGLPGETLSHFIKMPGVYPAGRLDKQSGGLLLLTDSGALQHHLSHPKFNKEKYYWAQVEGSPTDSDLEPLRQGITVSGIHYLPAKASVIDEPPLWPRHPPIRERKNIPTAWIELVLTEGKNHELKNDRWYRFSNIKIS